MYRFEFGCPRQYLEVSGQLHVSVVLTLGKGGSVGPPEQVWTKSRSEHSRTYSDSNFDSSVVEPAASRYTDCSTATLLHLAVHKITTAH
jgi:hypothetical protein